MPVPLRPNDIATLRGESGQWRVVAIVHERRDLVEAVITPHGERWVRPFRTVPLCDLTLVPVDLEEFA